MSVMRLAMLGSGSKGNGTLIESQDTRVLVDCGFSLAESVARCQRLGVDPASITAILVTHEHGDHINGVARLARKFSIPVWMTHGTYAQWKDRNVPQCERFDPQAEFAIGALNITPYAVPHDAREPCQFVISSQNRARRVGILSDAGHITAHMRSALADCDALLLECNHDPQMLNNGPYHAALKQRVAGDWGHLSNAQAATLLDGYNTARLQHLVLTHLSETNNDPELARALMVQALGCDPAYLVCAQQAQGLDWREVV
ncbi:MBL fold metallo-hydrolase [Sinimarinibacterium sp. NLF-5-8]|uniref:MBL fold metallo-hydrolase n=1 Tax=Sinimarinibacterium sp. NLF-5-8 TaxID=2698684 RepID=UPI00192EE20F|nr:MBL fold metallo-hydrolase [Sinimarinibacterium sp. NLF-5-8]